MPRHSDSRSELLKTAAELIWRGSYNSTSVDQICAACGIKKGSFYHHFASKEELTVASLEYGWGCFKEMLDDAFSPLRPPLERLRTFFREDRERQASLHAGRGVVCGCPMFALGAEICTQEPVLRAKVEELLTRTAKYFESAIREAHALGQVDAPDAAESAWQILTYWEGATTLARIRNDLRPINAAEEGVVRLLGVKRDCAPA